MAVRRDCRHYSTRSTGGDEVVQRCRVGANEEMPFACPDDCLFFEKRNITGAGWTVAGYEPGRGPGDDPPHR